MDSANMNHGSMYSATKDPALLNSATRYLVRMVSATMDPATMGLATKTPEK
jgi:hypothetical protein